MSTSRRMDNTVWCIQTIENYTAMKIKKLLLYLATRLNLTHNVEQKKPHTIKYMVYDSIYINKKQYKTSISGNKSLDNSYPWEQW